MIVLAPASRASDFKLFFSLGANFRLLPGYAYHYAIKVNLGNGVYPPEYGRGNDTVGKSPIFGPDFGIGLSYKNVTLTLSVIPFLGNFKGTYNLSTPSMWFYNNIAADSIVAPSKISGISLLADLKYTIPLGRAFQIYLGGGVRFFSADLELPNNIIFMEYYVRGPDYSYGVHTLDITKIDFAPVPLKVLGWSALGGTEFTPASHFWIFLEARYQTGKKDVTHPYYSSLDTTAAPVHLDLSGVAFSFGIRYALD